MADVKLELSLPQGVRSVVLDSLDLVLDDNYEFVKPQDAKYVAISFVSPPSVVGTIGLTEFQQLQLRVFARVLSISTNPTSSGTLTDMTIDTISDPNNGECVCLVTCKGTKISYVKVENVPT